jgi:AbrB family looped-hinge helix DNA binding protein
MVISMLMKKRMKISKGGQVSIPAPIRKRWGTTTVTLEDRGGEIVLKPVPDDPIEAAAGAFAGGPKIDWEKVVREEREAEAEAYERKFDL